MTSYVRLIGLLTLVCLGQQSMLAESKPLEMRWNELAPLISGQRVEMVMNDGAKVKGEVVAVREDTILLDVSSATKEFTKGNGSVPRAALAQINLERRRGGWGRTLGTVIGVLTGLTVGGYAAAHADSAGVGIPVFLGLSSAIGVGGYYAGRQLDRRITKIHIVP
ncbi:MAG: hypothetical protein ABIR70_24435 [Bryobacteraceae bacterium]